MPRKSSAKQSHPLRKAREFRGWSTYELARRSGVSQSTVFRIETGERQPSARTLAKLANVLGFNELGDLLKPWLEDQT